MTWQRLDTVWAHPDTASLPILQRTRRVPAWTMWSGGAVSLVMGIVCTCLWVELVSRW